MLIREYRIPFPATLEEYRIGMLYMISRATEEENRRSDGRRVVDVVKCERYYDSVRGIHGVYTEKVCHVGNLLPSFMKIFIPEAKSILIEKVRTRDGTPPPLSKRRGRVCLPRTAPSRDGPTRTTTATATRVYD